MSDRRTLPPRRRHEAIEFEHAGIRYVAGVGRFADGRLAELFLNAGKPGSGVETAARDCAVLASIALQHGVPIETIRHALTKLADGTAAGPIGRALELIGGEQ